MFSSATTDCNRGAVRRHCDGDWKTADDEEEDMDVDVLVEGAKCTYAHASVIMTKENSVMNHEQTSSESWSSSSTSSSDTSNASASR